MPGIDWFPTGLLLCSQRLVVYGHSILKDILYYVYVVMRLIVHGHSQLKDIYIYSRIYSLYIVYNGSRDWLSTLRTLFTGRCRILCFPRCSFRCVLYNRQDGLASRPWRHKDHRILRTQYYNIRILSDIIINLLLFIIISLVFILCEYLLFYFVLCSE